MKKLTTTLALLAAAGAAQAQSSVNLFALVDANLTHYSAGSKSGAGDDNVVNDGTVNGLNGSRWGIKANEDLGNGLRAGVLLESGVLVDTGSLGQGGRSFGRQGYIFLSSADLGELRIGRQYIFEDSVMWQSNPFGNALTLNPGTAVTNVGKSLPFWLNAPRADNVIQLQSLSYGGFQAGVQVAPQEGAQDRFLGLKLSYGAGPLYTGLSYEWNKSQAEGKNVNKSLTLAANYDFGVVKVLGGLQRNSELRTTSGNGAFIGSNLVVTGPVSFTADQIKGYTIGAEVPWGRFTFGANYTGVKYEAADGQNLSLGKVAVGVRYGLSKTAFLYASASQATGDLKDYIAQEGVSQAGLRVSF
ncbi:porin [Ideonella sp. YS5]|uniref:porin n=1 Tax=Ideonella sp. YS5 TaxID=3453714 RepID=UPI003EEFA1C7